MRYNGRMNTLQKTLNAIVGPQNVLVDEPMSTHTTFRIGGPADLFVIPQDINQACEAIRAVRESGETLYLLGRGSNVLVADAGLRGVVVQFASNVSAIEIGADGIVLAEAGATNAKIAAEACRAGLGGYEFAAGIPGTVGGAAIMNAGAYDGEFKDVAVQVSCLDADGNRLVLGADEARWGYRSSAIAERGLIVLSVQLKLHPANSDDIQARMDDLAQRRHDKQPLDKPSAGSTFKRPPGLFAGKLIQDCGMQGHRVGGAQVSTKHAGFVVNEGGATADDVMAVIRDVRTAVFDAYGVSLEPEVRLWGFA